MPKARAKNARSAKDKYGVPGTPEPSEPKKPKIAFSRRFPEACSFRDVEQLVKRQYLR